LGETSLVFLLASFLIYLYKNRFQAGRFAFLLPFTFSVLIVLEAIWGGFTPFLRTVVKNGVNTILIIFLFPIFKFLAEISDGEGEIKLKI